MSFKELDRSFSGIEKKIAEKLKARSSRELYASDLLVFGLTARAISLYNGMKEALEESNPYVFVILYRAQMETLATVNHLIKKPSDAKKFLHGGRKGTKYRISNILTLIDECKPKYPRLRGIYDEISEMAHPNSASHFLSTRIGEGRRISWRSKPSFSREEAEKGLKGLIEISNYVADDLGLLTDALMK